MERIKNEYIKEIMGVKGKPDIIDTIEKKRLQWYGHVKRMAEERIPLIMEWIPRERRKRGRPRKTWMEGVQTAMTSRNLEPDQWRKRTWMEGVQTAMTSINLEPDQWRKRTWMEGVQTAMTSRNLEPDQWRNREEWSLGSARRRQLLNKPDR
jgi:hypothetical protein